MVIASIFNPHSSFLAQMLYLNQNSKMHGVFDEHISVDLSSIQNYKASTMMFSTNVVRPCMRTCYGIYLEITCCQGFQTLTTGDLPLNPKTLTTAFL